MYLYCLFILILLCGCSSNSQSLGNNNVTTSMTTTKTSMFSSITTTEMITEESNKGIWGDVVGFDEIDGEYYFDGLPVTQNSLFRHALYDFFFFHSVEELS